MAPRARRWLWALGGCLVLLALVAAVFHARPLAFLDREALYRYAVTHLSREQKDELYARLMKDIPASMWEAVPDPWVGRVLQYGSVHVSKQAEIVANNAGMRDRRAYVPKTADRFRIVCLADSMVMGTAGPEEDRWGNRIESLLRDRGVVVGGRDIEVYHLGIGGWSGLNEASYLTHRLSDFAPDLVLVMMVDNDLGDSPGVMGIGQATFAFSPEQRHLGSGVVADHLPVQFGLFERNLLATGLGPESGSRWERTFRSWKRLESLLEGMGARMLFGVLESDALFRELVLSYAASSGLGSPLLEVSYAGERLPHDPHPNRRGHELLALAYLHALAELDWLPLDRAELPRLEGDLKLTTSPGSDPDRLNALQRDVVRDRLSETIAFDALTRDDVRAFLGGILPGAEERPLSEFPYGTPKSVFLLRARESAEYVLLDVETPPRPELYPFELSLLLNGVGVETLDVPDPEHAGRHRLRGRIPRPLPPARALEVTLLTSAHWSTIDDPAMKSYRLISVTQE